VELPTVLIVDDEPRVLDALEAILAAEFAVVRASDGEQALAVLERQDVAVILTDHRMPG
jgi:CheY-like chemotaxis protein